MTGDQALSEAYDAFAAEARPPGAVAGLVRDGRLEALWTHGVADLATGRPVDGRTLFRIASMTKCVTALALLSLRDEGRVRLDDPVLVHVPELAARPRATGDSPLPTLRDLLHHMGGDVNDDPWADRRLGMAEDAFSALLGGGWPAARAPGVQVEYSNLGYAVLGRAVANAAGEPFQAYVRRRLFDPLGLRDTVFDVPAFPVDRIALGYRRTDTGEHAPERIEPDGAFAAIGGLATTAEDYARFCAWLLAAWPPRDEPERGPLRRATVRELGVGFGMLFPRVPGDTSASVYGHGMIVTEEEGIGRYLQHAGGLPGYGSHVLLAPETGLAVFGFANRTYAAPVAANRAVARALRVERSAPASSALREAADVIARAYEAGSMAALGGLAADNLFLDMPLDEWDRALARLRDRFGELRGHDVEPRHALAGRIVLRCERGELPVLIHLAPQPRAPIQKIAFEA